MMGERMPLGYHNQTRRRRISPEQLEVTETENAVKVHSDIPHLVSLGSGRLSTAVTLLPLPEGRTTIGSGYSGVAQDIEIQGTGVNAEHCYIENSNGVITLYPIARMCTVDGVLVATPTRLAQGSMICFGRSNYFRFNHPQEARKMRDALPNCRISVEPLTFLHDLENDPHYLRMIQDAGRITNNNNNNNSSNRGHGNAVGPTIIHSNGAIFGHQKMSSRSAAARKRDSIESGGSAKSGSSNSQDRSSSGSGKSQKHKSGSDDFSGKFTANVDTPTGSLLRKSTSPTTPQPYVGEKLFTKDTATTRVSLTLLQGEQLAKMDSPYSSVSLTSVSTGSFSSSGSSSQEYTRSSQTSDNNMLLSYSLSPSQNSSTETTTSNSIDDTLKSKSSGQKLDSKLTLESFEESLALETPILGITKSGSPRTTTHSNSPGMLLNGLTYPIVSYSEQGEERGSDDSSTRSSGHSVKSGNGSIKSDTTGLDLEFDDLTDSQKDLTIHHQEMVQERKKEQEQEKLEQQRLEEILSMFAEYEKQVETEQHGNLPTVPISPSKENPIPTNMNSIYSNFASTNRQKLNLNLVPSIMSGGSMTVDRKAQNIYTPGNYQTISGPLDRMEQVHQRSDYMNRNSTKIKTNGSLTMLASPINTHKDSNSFGFQIRRCGSNSSNSEEESSAALTSEDTGTIKRRPPAIPAHFAGSPPMMDGASKTMPFLKPLDLPRIKIVHVNHKSSADTQTMEPEQSSSASKKFNSGQNVAKSHSITTTITTPSATTQSRTESVNRPYTSGANKTSFSPTGAQIFHSQIKTPTISAGNLKNTSTAANSYSFSSRPLATSAMVKGDGKNTSKGIKSGSRNVNYSEIICNPCAIDEPIYDTPYEEIEFIDSVNAQSESIAQDKSSAKSSLKSQRVDDLKNQWDLILKTSQDTVDMINLESDQLRKGHKGKGDCRTISPTYGHSKDVINVNFNANRSSGAEDEFFGSGLINLNNSGNSVANPGVISKPPEQSRVANVPEGIMLHSYIDKPENRDSIENVTEKGMPVSPYDVNDIDSAQDDIGILEIVENGDVVDSAISNHSTPNKPENIYENINTSSSMSSPIKAPGSCRVIVGSPRYFDSIFNKQKKHAAADDLKSPDSAGTSDSDTSFDKTQSSLDKDAGDVSKEKATSSSGVETASDTSVVFEEFDVKGQLSSLKKTKTELLSKINGLKRQIIDIETQENEAVRELEMERALLEGEHQSQMEQLQIDQEKIAHLKRKQTELVEKASIERKKERDRIDQERMTLFDLEEKHYETEQKLESCIMDADEDEEENEEEDKLLDKFQSEQEILERKRKAFEDMEFQQLEADAHFEEEKESLQRQLIDDQNSLLLRYKDREVRLQEIDDHQRTMLHQVRKEIADMETKRQSLTEDFKKDNKHSEKKSSHGSSSSHNPSKPRFIQLSSSTNSDDGKTPSSALVEVERNRFLMLEQQGSQVIEEQRKRLEELKRRAADEVRAQWEERKQKEQNRDSNNRKSFNSLESEDSSIGSSCEAPSEKETRDKKIVVHYKRGGQEPPSFIAKATLLGVMAEHSLPFTMAPVLIELSKTLAADRKALNHLSMDRTTASYKMRFGLALSFRQSTLSHLQTQYFSLNLDESTSSNLMRVLSVLVSYFCPKSHQVIVEHLCSFSVTKVNAASLYQEICDVFENQNIPWEKLVSILSDSCNVMRGCKSGLEVRIRNGKANHLLDIDGDSCHHIHNAAKVFCKPFAWYVEGLFTDVHNDFKWSVDLRDALAEICNLIGIAFTMPERFISHRWLSCHDVAMSTSRLLDAYWLFYYAFLPKESITVYTSTVLSIYKERDVSHEAQARIREIRKVLSQKNMTEDGKKRKKRIIEKLFYQKKKTCLTMRFYISAFQLLKQYVCMFETKQPLIHKLHDEQEEVFRGFLSCFVKPEVLDGKTAKTMATMDLSKEDVLLKKKQMFVGDGAKLIIEKCSSSDAIVNDFLTAVTKGYVDCAIYMQKKLPLNSKTLRCISAIDPVARGHSLTLTRLKVLPSILNIFTTEEAEAYNIEVHRYQVDPTLPSPDDNGSPIRVDKWWALAMKKYPTLGKLVIALLSCFHGPQVESSFSIMGDVIDKKSGRIKIETFDAIQTIKYGLLAQGKSALEVFDRKNYLHDPVDTRICNNLRGAYSKYKSELDVKRKKADEKRELYKLQKEKVETKARAKRLQKLMDKKARLAHIRKFRLISKSKFAKK